VVEHKRLQLVSFVTDVGTWLADPIRVAIFASIIVHSLIATGLVIGCGKAFLGLLAFQFD